MPSSRSCVLGARQCSQTSLCRECPPRGDCCCFARPAAAQLCAGSAQEQCPPPQWCAAASSSAAAVPAHTPNLTALPACALIAGARLPPSPGLYCASWRAYVLEGLHASRPANKQAQCQPGASQSDGCRPMWASGAPTWNCFSSREVFVQLHRVGSPAGHRPHPHAHSSSSACPGFQPAWQKSEAKTTPDSPKWAGNTFKAE